MTVSDTEIWDVAGRYAGMVGRMPVFVTSCVRGIRNGQELFAGKNVISLKDLATEVTQKAIGNSPTMHSVLYHAAREYYPNGFQGKSSISPEDMIRLFQADELMAIVTITYLTRRIGPKCDPIEWDMQLKRLRNHITIGRLVGNLLPNFSTGNGMLYAGLTLIGNTLLLQHAPDVFKKIRREATQSKLFFVPERELEQFRTTSYHIAARLAQAAGFGLQMAEGFFPKELSVLSKDDPALPWVFARHWIEGIHLTGTPFQGVDIDNPLWKAPREQVVGLRDRLKTVLEAGEHATWLIKDKEHLTAIQDVPLELKVAE